MHAFLGLELAADLLPLHLFVLVPLVHKVFGSVLLVHHYYLSVQQISHDQVLPTIFVNFILVVNVVKFRWDVQVGVISCLLEKYGELEAYLFDLV